MDVTPELAKALYGFKQAMDDEARKREAYRQFMVVWNEAMEIETVRHMIEKGV